MRISSGIVAAVLMALLATAVEAGSGAKLDSPQVAFERGLSAYKAGTYEIAVPALEEAAAKGSDSNRFFAEFYLARIYSDASGTQTNHAKAFALFQKLADENADADPDEGPRAPFVAKSLTALAGYLRTGLGGVERDEARAVECLQNAATSFGDQEAQFELAKIYLSRGGSDDIKLGRHFLSVLAKDGYASAQAYLADLHWRGRYVKKDEQRALALITVAVENAPPHDRIWIEDAYVSIYCGSSQGLRKQADGVVAVWRQIFARPGAAERKGLDAGAQPQRTCRTTGESVEIHRAPGAPAASEPAGALVSKPATGRDIILQGNAAGISLRDVGVK